MVYLTSWIEEGKVKVNIDGVFYNPHMKLSRDISVTVLNRIEEELNVLDGFAASGIRGIRYYVESDNVSKVDFIDIDDTAVQRIKENLEQNGVDGETYKTRFESFDSINNYDLIEIDPFGSPSKYIPIVIAKMKKRRFYLSVTATDTAVLCGRHVNACIRNYIAKPLHDSTCHETGLRILLAYIAKIAFIYDYNIIPLIGFYYRHQMKVIVRLERDVVGIHNNLKNLDYIYRQQNLQKGIGIGHEIAGPLWIGKYYDNSYIDRSIDLVKLIADEKDLPYHYDIHEIAKTYKISRIPKIEVLLEKLDGSRTHFNPKGIKTEHKIEKIVDVMRGL